MPRRFVNRYSRSYQGQRIQAELGRFVVPEQDHCPLLQNYARGRAAEEYVGGPDRP